MSETIDIAAMNLEDLSAEFARLSEDHAAWKASSDGPADQAAYSERLEAYAERMMAIRRRSIELRVGGSGY